MKKTQEILGLPVIGALEGMEVGKVKKLIVNPKKNSIDYILVESESQIFSSKVITVDDIIGIGQDALTIKGEEVVKDLSEFPFAIDLLKENIQVYGVRILTQKGRLIGEIEDIYIDEDKSCKVAGIEYISDIIQNKISIIPKASIIAFRDNFVLVKENVENSLVEDISDLCTKKNSSKDETNLIKNKDKSTTDDISIEGKIIKEQSNSYNSSSLFEQRYRQYLNGRKATKTIKTDKGSIIISDGNTITDEVIEQAQKCGKLIELVMNNRG
ncbi:hypothetical protein RBH29_07545 [Herbivorax sp. ANBcel31]|uniref:PRC-barrel domain-containing protein n=1 Tax=Herbivorax sp. ANBcel31 TaxID=3069754 RepID=UPI0027B218D9|nr:PRC-barrel domain-containing protein [Herbivorax sp. ANBcel31]MDQ2086281.1 hypothetical protein [Herbivorax sp. ANBcel31]